MSTKASVEAFADATAAGAIDATDRLILEALAKAGSVEQGNGMTLKETIVMIEGLFGDKIPRGQEVSGRMIAMFKDCILDTKDKARPCNVMSKKVSKAATKNKNKSKKLPKGPRLVSVYWIAPKVYFERDRLDRHEKYAQKAKNFADKKLNKIAAKKAALNGGMGKPI